jgi:hypothetical protein
VTRYLSLAEFWYLAEHVTGINAATLAEQHVRMNVSESGSFADRSHPTTSGAAIEALPVVADEDRSLTPLTDGEIDGARSPRHERNHGWLVSLAEDPQRAVSAVETEDADVCK